ncbi:Bax inhibitor-1/YccA family protein [Pedobacter heparinus]|uniref:Bax inhibitor-1/YccA family protein n=1 Tax=Pedobacter heparinus (strain ATCC 13125 / DSM 2366 / CIP 104194 / JCM 7457 / NBRC 12017 / NCIMB 9290 / NRRL B-14731 / HIM 762-3) TaxID=485917 RepID=C6XUW5_PEDHD|nr:Bax inhibitor-1/YccA family protein [Pedobacter heparinus]ACU05973.1 protein of unknown function UPF0005 [Pedobacter heparinus DSM 2366]
MDNNNNYDWAQKSVFVQPQTGVVAKKFFANVFLWMFVALSLSTFSAYFMSANAEFSSFLRNPETLRPTTLGWIATFAPLGLVLLMSAGLNRLSYGALVGVFVLYSVLTGLSLSFILLVYTSTSVLSCFIGAAGIFGIMAIMGYTTNIDLSKFGPILMIGVVGLIIASVVNMFIQSANFSLFMAFIGIAIFTALTAYDVQKLKRIGEGLEANGAQMDADTKKLAIMGALSLYLDFLNIFIYLLRIFGDRR